MSEREETCKGCRFYAPEEGEDLGYCRIRAATTHSAARWPAVADDDWCGEWASLPVDASELDFPRGWEPHGWERRTDDSGKPVGPWRKGDWTVLADDYCDRNGIYWVCPPGAATRVKCTGNLEGMLRAENMMMLESGHE